jgi:hypothetical protein
MNSDNPKNQNRFREITIPGDVLDDERLSDGAKIMYGKIARLSYKEGHCWASNSFLDGTKTGRNASRFITELKTAGYIDIKNERSKYREIRICRVESKVNIANSGGVESSDADSGGEPTPPNLADLNPQPRRIRRSNIANSGGQTLLDSTNLNSTTASSPKPQKYIKILSTAELPPNRTMKNRPAAEKKQKQTLSPLKN